jgi:hypothetical protein
MVDCWAEPLGNCSEKQSAEHLVSKAVMDAHGQQKGPNTMFDPNTGSYKIVGSNSSVAKILCKFHNTELSCLDSEAAKAYATLKKLTDPSYLRTLKPNSHVVVAELNGNLLERWFLKTAIDHIYGYAYKSVLPPKQLVEIAFGKRRFPELIGLSTIAHSGHHPTPNDKGVTIVPIVGNSDNHLYMVVFDFAGWRYVIPAIPNWNLQDIWQTTLNNYLKNPSHAFELIEYCRTGHVAYHMPCYSINIKGINITAEVHFQWNNIDTQLPTFSTNNFTPWILPPD